MYGYINSKRDVFNALGCINASRCCTHPLSMYPNFDPPRPMQPPPPPPRWKIKTKQRTTTTQQRDKRFGEKFCTNIVKMTENLIKRGGLLPTLKTSASSNQQNGGKRVWKSFTWLISHVPKLFSYA